MPDLNPAALSPQSLPLADLHPFWPVFPGPDNGELLESIRLNGLLRPLWAFADEGRLKLLAGERRRKALTTLGFDSAPVVVFPAELPRRSILAAALNDNKERGYEPVEVALIWRFLVEREAALAEDLSCCLGLRDSVKIKSWALAAASLPLEGLAALADGRLDLELAARLAGWKDEDRRAVLTLFEALAPSKQKKKQWLDWLEDIARRENLSPASVLAEAELRQAVGLAGSQGRPAAENAARRLIWRRRHPVLAELLQRREARIKALALPASIKLISDPSLEDLNFSFTLTFADLNEFRSQLDYLATLPARPEFSTLLDDSDDQALALGGDGERDDA